MNAKILITTLLLSLTTSSGIFAQFAGGDGSTGNPYQIATATQLDEVRNHLSSHFVLTAEIDLNTAPYNSGSGWLPIGDNSTTDNTTRFTGSLNGDGHKITGLFIDRSSTNYVGLFGYIGSGGSISNLGVEGSISNSYAAATIFFDVQIKPWTKCRKDVKPSIFNIRYSVFDIQKTCILHPET